MMSNLISESLEQYQMTNYVDIMCFENFNSLVGTARINQETLIGWIDTYGVRAAGPASAAHNGQSLIPED